MIEAHEHHTTFPPELWDQTPVAVQEYIRALAARVAALAATVQQLLERLQQDHATPHDCRRVIPHKPCGHAPAVCQVDRKRGGHPGQTRALVPIEAGDTVVPVKPLRCLRCQPPWQGEAPQPHRHQVRELPLVKPVVTE